MAQQYAARPSEILEIRDGLAAYQFDRAVSTIGNVVESALNKNNKKKRPLPQEDIIRRLLTKKEAPGAYDTLVQRAKKTIKLKPGQDITEVL